MALSKAQHLAEILIRNPEDFYWLLEGTSLGGSLSPEELFDKFHDTIFGFQSPYRRISFLHRLHRRHFLRIAMRDIMDIANFEQTITDLSFLAETLVRMVTQLVLSSFAEKNKLPDSKFAVIALGKLGGAELNYSSDIDLMFVYDKDGVLPDGENYSKVFQRIAEEICRILNEQTEHGVLYRVDTRLRPDGVSGILCQSLSAYLHYYEYRGRLWERQMLIKSRPVGGDREFGQNVLKQFEPFIYPRRIQHPLKDIVAHRKKSETRTSEGVNVKTDPGGIRDIEFIVQALQLQFGGQEPDIRDPNTLAALKKLAVEEKFLSEEEAEQLRQHYIFLREVEHGLQLQQNLQVHVLSDNEPEQSLIHPILGYNKYNALYRDTQNSMEVIRKIFTGVFKTEPVQDQDDYSTYSKEDWEELFERRGFPNPQKAATEFQSLATGRFPNNHDSYTRDAFWKVCPYLLDNIQKSPAPANTLTDFERIVRTYSAVRSLYELFAANPSFLQLLLKLIFRAPKIVQWLVQQPSLVDTLIGLPEESLKVKDAAELYAPLSDENIREENWLDRAIDIHHEVILTILSQWITKDVELPEIYRLFSAASTALLHTSLDYWLGDLDEKLAVVIAGSAAANTMVFSSDYDIMFVFRSDIEATEMTGKVEKYIRHMQAYTRRGRLFAFDFRLRPEGKSSPLVMPVNKYLEYMDNRMSSLEFQAMGKSSFLWGDQDLWQEVSEHLQSSLRSLIHTGPFWQELMKLEQEAIRQKMKRTGKNYVYHKGGLFAVRNTLEWKNLFTTFSDQDRDIPETEALQRVFSWYQKLRWYLSLRVSGSIDALPSDREQLEIIAQLVGLPNDEQLLEKVDTLLRSSEQINEKFRRWLTEEF